MNELEVKHNAYSYHLTRYPVTQRWAAQARRTGERQPPLARAQRTSSRAGVQRGGQRVVGGRRMLIRGWAGARGLCERAVMARGHSQPKCLAIRMASVEFRAESFEMIRVM